MAQQIKLREALSMGWNQKAFAFAGLVACAGFSASAEEHRQLGAHVHGQGHLNIAIEGRTVSMELEAPGADIAGFEHEPVTPGEKAAVEAAKAKLADGLSLFRLPAEAGCTQKSAEVAVAAEHEHEQTEHRHAEFHAAYAFECAAPERLTSMTMGYFEAFAGAHELDVSLISPKGQTSAEVTRQKPRLDLAGVM